MMPIEKDIPDYLMWMKIHNYARTTIANREVYGTAARFGDN